jgi:SAM-dependent methyltransferase
MFVASDVQINNVKQLCEYANEATKYENIGVYTPSVSSKSRTAYPILNNRTSSYIRECGVVEGFFFMANTEILKTIFPLTNFKYGWAVDVLTCDKAYELNRICVVDDRIEIFHPTSKTAHSIDAKKAEEEWVKLIGWPVINRCRDRQQQLNDAHKFVNKATSLDLGCGGKIRNPFLAEKSFGIDLIEDTTKGIVSADLIIEKIPFPDSSFEYCTAFDFIEHIPRIIYNPTRKFPFVILMNEIHRCLKSNGYFLSHTPAYPHSPLFRDPTHVNYITEETFPIYFDNINKHAQIYGFTGSFKVIKQGWNGFSLVTLLQKTVENNT